VIRTETVYIQESIQIETTIRVGIKHEEKKSRQKQRSIRTGTTHVQESRQFLGHEQHVHKSQDRYTR